MTGNPPGFNPTEVRGGLHEAMLFGQPPDEARRPVFFVPSATFDPFYTVDADGVPFDPDSSVVEKQYLQVSPLCAMEFTGTERDPRIDQAGSGVYHGRVLFTLLDEEYSQVADADHVVIDGDKYYRDWEAPPLGLGSIGVHQIRFTAEDEA